MKKQLVITDLTRMQGDRVCVFGVDADGKGMRPDIPPTGIREGYLLDNKGRRVIRPFAVVEFDFVRSRPKPPHTEDWEINPNCAPRLIRYLSEDESRALLERILDKSIRSIFGADIHDSRYVNEGEGNRSLGTVRANEVLSVRCSQRETDKHDYRTEFSDATREVYDLPVTDLAFREYCENQRLRGRAIDVVADEVRRRLRGSHVFIRVGLARPFAKMFNRCYLQVCAIHAFPGYALGSEGVGGFDFPGDRDRRGVVPTLR